MNLYDGSFIAAIKKNQRQIVAIRIDDWKKEKRIDIRHYTPTRSNLEPSPTSKGVSIPINKYEELLAGIQDLEPLLPASRQVVAAQICREADQEIRITASRFRGHDLFSIRVYVEDKSSSLGWKPTQEGISLNVSKYEEFKRAIESIGEAIDNKSVTTDKQSASASAPKKNVDEKITDAHNENLVTHQVEQANDKDQDENLVDTWNGLLVGMYVRVPVQEGEADFFREFRIGRIKQFNKARETVLVILNIHYGYQPPKDVEWEFDIANVSRCKLLADTDFVHEKARTNGRILISEVDEFTDGIFLNYFVFLNGEVSKLPENEIIASCIRMDPDPFSQLQEYEFHHPIWRPLRDRMIEVYSTLDNATFGIKELVGSRVLLLPHQAQVISDVLGDLDCRFLLADEVGLGKTIEALVILKGLRNRNPGLSTLLIVPDSLKQQWLNELNNKFWIDLDTLDNWEENRNSSDGLIVTTGQILLGEITFKGRRKFPWQLAIIDEAHQLHKNPLIYDECQVISNKVENLLILSATPIQRRAVEFLSLLKLLDSRRYGQASAEEFNTLLDSQEVVRSGVAYLGPTLTEEKFDLNEFTEEMNNIRDVLKGDSQLEDLIQKVEEDDLQDNEIIQRAKATISHLSENYRIERRVIRNRRKSLDIELPIRTLTTDYSYMPSNLEIEFIEELYDYVETLTRSNKNSRLVQEYSRLLIHSASSSSDALINLLQIRISCLEQRPKISKNQEESLLRPTTFREEANRRIKIIKSIPVQEFEDAKLESLLWKAKKWNEYESSQLKNLLPSDFQHVSDCRSIAIQRCIHHEVEVKGIEKIIVFSSFHETIDLARKEIGFRYGSTSVEEFKAGMEEVELQDAADRFQSDKSCKFLLCDELGGEGRNFQIADSILHVDLPWTPAQVEQRIGRVDRIGRTGEVLSMVVFSRGTFEQDLFDIWNDAFSLFTESMSGMEIALEDIQDDLMEALSKSVRRGLKDQFLAMKTTANNLRIIVEEERYFEEGTIDRRLRDELQDINAKYNDGSILREVTLSWAKLAGLAYTYNPASSIVVFNPNDFEERARKRAKFLPPNMEEALKRSRNPHELVLRGTFDREKAITREDLIFFSPTDDPWTDAIIHNAFEADRGRCCAIRRTGTNLDQEWKGFEILLSLKVNPRFLYETRLDPSNLVKAQGYLFTPIFRVLISLDGEIIPKSHPIWACIEIDPSKLRVTHLGKRSGSPSPIREFVHEYPSDVWNVIVEIISNSLSMHIEEEFEFTDELAQEATDDFEKIINGYKAAEAWRRMSNSNSLELSNLEIYKSKFQALTLGIKKPLIRVESICYWELMK